ncbi:hypothetical protein [Micromonospora avicenniae]|uniref:hypothetical protein n=1 Tax=Micromonospora avicenniae TaxID=1198245 RepID=UPI00331C8A3D
MLLKTSGMLDLPIAIAQSQQRLDRRDQLAQQVREAEERLVAMIPRAQRAMTGFGEPHILQNLTVDSAHEVFEILGLGRNLRTRVIHKPATAFRVQQALLSEDVHRLLRQIKKDGLLIRRRRNEVGQLENAIRNLAANSLLNPLALAARTMTVEQRLDEICLEFERAF